MGSQNSTVEDNYPYSSWGSSLDDIICGEGKICGDAWTPISTRKSSFDRRASEGNYKDENSRKSQSSSMFNYRHSLYSEHQVITQQPLPIEPRLRSVATSPDLHYPTRGISTPHDRPEPPSNLIPVPGSMEKKNIHKKSTKRKRQKILSALSSAHDEKRSASVRLGRTPPHKVKIGLANKRAHLDSRSEFIRKSTTIVRKTHISSHKTPDASQKLHSFTTVPINSWGSSTISLHRVVAPREKRGMEPPEPFRIKRVPDRPNFYISTYYL